MFRVICVAVVADALLTPAAFAFLDLLKSSPSASRKLEAPVIHPGDESDRANSFAV
jgi:hypothetical protein